MRNTSVQSLCSYASKCQIQGFVFYLNNDKNTLNLNTMLLNCILVADTFFGYTHQQLNIVLPQQLQSFVDACKDQWVWIAP